MADSEAQKRKTVVFFARVADRATLDRVEFYRQDICLLRELGFDVKVVTRVANLTIADYYFVWWWTWAFAPVALARLLRRPVIVTGVFDLWDFDRRPRIHRWLMAWALRNAQANVFVSRLEHREVPIRLSTRSPAYVPLAIDRSEYGPGPKSRTPGLVVSIAWLEYGNAVRKGIPALIGAFERVIQAVPHARLKLAGAPGTGVERLERLVAQHGLVDVVEFTGAVSREEKVRLLRTCAVYAQPSQFEGFGLAILEAMACGAPVVVSERGAIPEVVGRSGVFVDPDDENSIAAAIVSVISQPAISSRLSRSSELRAHLFFDASRRKREMGALMDGLA